MNTDGLKKLTALQARLAACRKCPGMIGPSVHGPPVLSRVYLLGQAPGPREAGFGRPFAWTAGRTLFRWFQEGVGLTEQNVRELIYMSAVARCFPGKAKGGGDRKPDEEEIRACRPFIKGEVQILQPTLIIPVGGLAIEQVLQHKGLLAGVVGKVHRVHFLGVDADAICLPHPSGASTWHRMEPGRSLLEASLRLLHDRPELQALRVRASRAEAAGGAKKLQTP